jgi:hypothetical protein
MARPDATDLTWIFGSSRSGSTWLLRMLAEHPDVVPIDETGIGHHLGVWRPISLAWGTSEGEPPPLTTFARVKAGNRDYVFSDAYREGWEPLLRDLLLGRLALQHEPGRRMVVKEPGGSQVADWIMRLLPGARLVFLLRDGRDVVDSWLDAYRPGGWHYERDGGYPVAAEGRMAFIRWQAAVWLQRTQTVQRAYEACSADRRVLVRYEDLLADPDREVERVHAAIGLARDPAQVRDAVARHAFASVAASERGEGQFVRQASPGGWRESMSRAEQHALHAVLGPKLRELGYA